MGTRTSILQTISAWIDDPNEPPIYWLSGMAGIGKSTIAHTIAEQEDKKHRLGASFFFSRAEADRRNHLLVYPTIAYQLAGFNDSLRESIVQALETDADIGGRQMQKQFDHLIAGPLSKLKLPGKTILFVLDALDECDLATGAVEILTRCAVELPRISKEIGVSLKLFLTSRPELHIHDQFNERSLQGAFNSFVLHDAEQSVVRADIELFLTQRLGDLAIHYRVSQPWPTAEEIKALALRSDNLFVFASTTINFIGGVKSGRALQHRLDRLLKPDPNNSTSAYAQLDALYCQVLVDAENELEETLPNPKETFRKVLETIVLLLNPLPVTSLAELLSLEMDDVLTATQDLRSILIIPDDPTSSKTIHIFHPSFYDFITSTGRDSKGFMIATIHAGGREGVCVMAYFPDGQRIATGDETGRITVWSTSTGAEIVSMQEQEYGSKRKIESLAVSGDGSRIASLHQRIYQPKQINLWDATAGGGSLLGKIGGPVSTIQSIAFSPIEMILASVASDGTLQTWD
ncbi:hypothetical protein M407DRAFT_223474, partial [Tulasnella calospora MUT 4182]